MPLSAQMNEVEALPQMMLQQVANDVMLRINDVALCANGEVAVICKSKIYIRVSIVPVILILFIYNEIWG